jgi:hypothetical protein
MNKPSSDPTFEPTIPNGKGALASIQAFMVCQSTDPNDHRLHTQFPAVQAQYFVMRPVLVTPVLYPGQREPILRIVPMQALAFDDENEQLLFMFGGSTEE